MSLILRCTGAIPCPKLLANQTALSLSFSCIFLAMTAQFWSQVLPRRGMSAKEAVEAQLNALQQNDTPW